MQKTDFNKVSNFKISTPDREIRWKHRRDWRPASIDITFYRITQRINRSTRNFITERYKK